MVIIFELQILGCFDCGLKEMGIMGFLGLMV